jgi:hypothetical protein
VTAFLAELYAPPATREALAERMRAAASALAREGRAVELSRAIFVPGDETWLWLFEAASEEEVRAVATRARVDLDRVVRAESERARRVEGDRRT